MAQGSREQSFFATVRADVQAMADLKGTRLNSVGGLIDVLLLPGTLAVLLFRLSCLFHSAGLRPISRLIYLLNTMLFATGMAPGTEVGPGLVVPHPVGAGFARQSKLGRNVHLLLGAAIGGGRSWDEDPSKDGFPTIGDGCWIFSGAKVLGPVHVGDHAFIGPNSVVMRSVPRGAIVFGNPARVIGYRKGFAPEAPGDSPAPAMSPSGDHAGERSST